MKLKFYFNKILLIGCLFIISSCTKIALACNSANSSNFVKQFYNTCDVDDIADEDEGEIYNWWFNNHNKFDKNQCLVLLLQRIDKYLVAQQGFTKNIRHDAKRNKFTNVFREITCYYITHYDLYQTEQKDNLLTHTALTNDMKNYNNYINICRSRISNSSVENCAFLNIEACSVSNVNDRTKIKSLQNDHSLTKLGDKYKSVNDFFLKYNEHKNCATIINLLKSLRNIYDVEEYGNNNMFYSRLRDDEIQLLIKLYKYVIKLQDKDITQYKNTNTVVINLFTRLDMCQFCWTIWQKCIDELRTLFAIKFKNNKLNLFVNVYYLEDYKQQTLLQKKFTHQKDAALFEDSFYKTNNAVRILKDEIQKLQMQNINTINNNGIANMKRSKDYTGISKL